MRASPALLLHPKFLLLLATLFIFSTILSSAAVARSGEQPISFVSQQQGRPQQQQQQQGQQLQPQPSTKQQQQQEQNQHQNQDSQPPIPAQDSQKPPAETQEEKLEIWRPQTSTESRLAPVLVSASTLVRVPASSPTSVSTTTSQSQVPSAPPSPAGSLFSSSSQTQKQQQTAKPKPPAIPQREYKYFHEAGSSYTLTHYDARYYKGIVPYASHRAVLTHLIRSYLTTFAALGLETWLAHGTLLGWWWNGKTMPWDWDLDVQVGGDTMAELASRFNMTLHDYAYVDEEGKDQTRTYLLDVNPFGLKLDRADGLNMIDARWIDVETGMFVDITNLLERDPRGRPGVLSCKNFHRYTKAELYPLRESEFEGVPALVPWEFEKILVAEYGAKSLVVTEWEGHRWDPVQQEWIKINYSSGAKKEVL